MGDLSLFDMGPEGFKYSPEVITVEEEAALLAYIRDLPFKEFEFQGYLGKRRVVSYGWRYDIENYELNDHGELPAFLMGLRERAGEFAGIAPDELVHTLVTEYTPGAPIGWHRDRPVYGEVVGVSLLSACALRFRRKIGLRKWERYSHVLEPRSAYLFSGRSRLEWEHSIAPVTELRYSITFRTLRDGVVLK
jgi:alkylated DNA repair dioxygenase AlkB